MDGCTSVGFTAVSTSIALHTPATLCCSSLPASLPVAALVSVLGAAYTPRTLRMHTPLHPQNSAHARTYSRDEMGLGHSSVVEYTPNEQYTSTPVHTPTRAHTHPLVHTRLSDQQFPLVRVTVVWFW